MFSTLYFTVYLRISNGRIKNVILINVDNLDKYLYTNFFPRIFNNVFNFFFNSVKQLYFCVCVFFYSARIANGREIAVNLINIEINYTHHLDSKIK